MNETKSCPKCGHNMANKSAVYALAQRAPEDVMMAAGVRLNQERSLDVIAHHCAKCSFVEFYAADYLTLDQNPPHQGAK
jgi:predicted nucleic-acid-binding Zn-ribbon protein